MKIVGQRHAAFWLKETNGSELQPCTQDVTRKDIAMVGGMGGMAEEGDLAHGADDAACRRSEGSGFAPVVSYMKPSARPLGRHAGGRIGGTECKGPYATIELELALLIPRFLATKKVN